MNHELMKKQLIRDEGRKPKLYTDSVGKKTIGIGYNIDDLGLSDEAIDFLYEETIAVAIYDVERLYPEWMSLNEARQHVLVNMSFNLGYRRFRGFKLFWKAVKAGDWEEAARQMKASKWYSQVGIRADRLIKMMRSGE